MAVGQKQDSLVDLGGQATLASLQVLTYPHVTKRLNRVACVSAGTGITGFGTDRKSSERRKAGMSGNVSQAQLRAGSANSSRTVLTLQYDLKSTSIAVPCVVAVLLLRLPQASAQIKLRLCCTDGKSQ